MKGLQIIFCLIFILVKSVCFSQQKSDKNEFTFMFYNTENFFDSNSDSLTNDDNSCGRQMESSGIRWIVRN